MQWIHVFIGLLQLNYVVDIVGKLTEVNHVCCSVSSSVQLDRRVFNS